MNQQELEAEIKRLHVDEKITQKSIGSDEFLNLPQYSELRQAFYDSKYKKYDKQLHWHQLVRLVLEPSEQREYLYNRLLNLLLEFRRSEDYFTFKTEEGLYQIPDILSDLNKLRILYQKYFQIYQNILNQIHFDHPKEKKVGRIQGRINWSETIRNNTVKFPTNFVTSVSKKVFHTSENVLLVLCARWMNIESNRLLKENFKEPLSDSNKKILYQILEKTEFILKKFPFQEVMMTSKQFWNIPYDLPNLKLNKIESDAAQRVQQGIVKNKHYKKLLIWIEEFRGLHIKNIGNKTPTKHVLDSLKNIDTVYEAWIFMEFVSFLKDKNCLTNFELGKHPKCEFVYNQTTVTFWYGKNFYPKKGIVWAKHHNPDFTATIGDEVIGVFDAKNYSEGEPVGGTHDKILAYLNNFDTNFGALIYPNHPPNWDELSESERSNLLDKDIFENHFPEYSKSEKRKIRNDTIQVPWDKLQQEYKQLIPRWSQIINQKQSGKKSRFHFEQTVAYLRMSPENTTFSMDIKNKTLEYIFDTIVKAIPLTVNQNFK
jgi:hypothetical protein